MERPFSLSVPFPHLPLNGASSRPEDNRPGGAILGEKAVKATLEWQSDARPAGP
jgi:hypothetical protein